MKSALIMMYMYLMLIICVCSILGGDIPVPHTTQIMLSYDQNGDSVLDESEFSSLCSDLFRQENIIKQRQQVRRGMRLIGELFRIFDQNSNGYIDVAEFYFCYWNWVNTIRQPRSAFVVIDVQNDFISGSLKLNPFPAKHNGEDVVRPINRLLDTVPFTKVYYSLDWHPPNHVSFIDNVNMRAVDPSSNVSAAHAKVFDTVVFQGPPKMSQKLWPSHCVQGTQGAQLHKDLKVVHGSDYIYKGINPDIDSYSVFWDNSKKSETPLHTYLVKEGITDVYVAGLAYDVCVGASALDALNLGYRTILIDDCSRGVDLSGIEATKKSIEKNYGVVVNSDEVKDMVRGVDRRVELAYKLALELKKKMQEKSIN